MSRVEKARQPGQKTRAPAISPPRADPNRPSSLRIAENALRDAGWSASARKTILRLIKDGRGDEPFIADKEKRS